MAKITDIMAIYGAVVSTGVAICGIYIAWRDRGRLKLSTSFDKKQHQIAQSQKITVLNALEVRVVNSGRRPVKLKHWGIRKPGSEPIAVTALDCMLTESEDTTFYVIKPDLTLPEGVDEISEVIYFFVKSSAGKEWTFSKKLRKEIEESTELLDKERESKE